MNAAVLTPRETQICELLIRGLSNMEVGHKLGISIRTVEDHRSRIYKAYSVHNLAGLIWAVGVSKDGSCPLCGRAEAVN